MAESTSTPGRYTPVAVLIVTLLVFAVVIAYISLWLREGLRDQILQREGEALTEVASLQLTTEADTLAQLGVRDAPGELLNAVLKTSKLRGVFAVRVFDSERKLNGALPFPWSETPPSKVVWSILEQGRPVTELHARESAAEVIGIAPSAPKSRATEPLLETWLPLRRADSTNFAGAAQMWTDGHAVAIEFQALDRQLATQAMLAWVAGSAIITTLLMWAFRRLAAANRELAARSEDLLRANRELILAAKTSALGAVTAHLMHELKNPVAGLEEFVASQSESGTRAESEGELAAASELTRRLRRMINDVAAVIRDEQTGSHFELTVEELVTVAADKARSTAQRRGIALQASGPDSAPLSARRANLAVLVLTNLVHNAIEASPPGSIVLLRGSAIAGQIILTVEDDGPGLPPTVLDRLFQPCTSTKRGGTGLGLALSQQLARQAGGRIELVRTDSSGTCFRVVLDVER